MTIDSDKFVGDIMTDEERKRAIEVIKSECYVFNPMNFDLTVQINTALDRAIEALELIQCEQEKS